MTSFDDLVEQLLYDLALAGSRGIGAEELERAVKAFYDRDGLSQSHAPHESGPLFSDAPTHTPVTVDSDLVDAVWTWLVNRPDVHVQPAEATETGGPSNDVAAQAPPAAKAATVNPNRNGQRLVVSAEKVWLAITGHGIDTKRVPAKEFDLLSIIASRGPEGILQPELTRVSQQDKRSVPKRTDELAKKGYVSKEKVIAVRTQTAILKLWKYDNQPNSGPRHVRASPITGEAAAENIIYYDKWYSGLIRLLQENGGLAALHDLRFSLGIRGNRAWRRAFARSIRRLVIAGLLRKLKTKAQTKPKGNWVHCVQLMRDPTDVDQLAFRGYDAERAIKDKSVEENNSNDLVADKEDSTSDDDYSDSEEFSEEEADTIVPARREPQWTPDLQLPNFVYDVVDNAGPDGISSMELNARTMGPFWRRPLDELMLKLTDIWQTSQPAHLRHLTILRDTGIQGKGSHYKYVSLRNFQEAVDSGRVEWRAVTENQKGSATKNGQSSTDRSNTIKLDDWGFTKPDLRLFADRDGQSSLLQCQIAARNDMRLTNTTDDLESAVGSTSVPSTPRRGPKRRTMGSTGRSKASNRAGRITSPLNKRVSLSSERSEAGQSKAIEVYAALSVSETNNSKDNAVSEVSRQTLPEPGVYINPADTVAERLRYSTPRKTRTPLIAVFKSAKLKERDWFRDEPNPRRSLRNHTDQAGVAIDADGGENDDIGEEAPLPASKTCSNVAGKNTTNDAGDGALELPKRKRGRPSKADIAARAALSRQLSLQGHGQPSIADTASQTGLAEQAARDNGGSLMVKLQVPKNILAKYAEKDTDAVKDTTSPIQEIPTATADAGQAHGQAPSSTFVVPLAEATGASPVLPIQSPYEGLHSKSYTLKHPEIQWVHHGGGRYAAASSSIHSKVLDKSIPKILSNNVGPPGSDVLEVAQGAVSSENPQADRGSAGAFTTPQGVIQSSLNHSSGYSTDRSLTPIGPNLDTTARLTPRRISRAQTGARTDVSTTPADDIIFDGDPMEVQGDFQVAQVHQGLPELRPVRFDHLPAHADKGGKKTGVNRRAGTVRADRVQIVLDTVKTARGVFPGAKNLFHPFSKAWDQKYHQNTDPSTIERLVDDLVKEGRLNKYEFNFKDGSGKIQHRDLVTLPNIGPGSAQARTVEKAIIDLHPRRYLPEVFQEGQPTRSAKDTYAGNSRPSAASEAFLRAEGVWNSPQWFLNGLDEFPADKSILVDRANPPAPRDFQIPKIPRVPSARKPSTGRPPGRPKRSEQPFPNPTGLMPDEISGRIRSVAMQMFLSAPLQVLHESSGTVGTGSAFVNLPSTYVVLQSLWKRYQTTPRCLQDILNRSPAFDMVLVDPSEFPKTSYHQQIERVQIWEETFVKTDGVLGLAADLIFINHTLNQPHIVPAGTTIPVSPEFQMIDPSVPDLVPQAVPLVNANVAASVSNPSTQGFSPYVGTVFQGDSPSAQYQSLNGFQSLSYLAPRPVYSGYGSSTAAFLSSSKDPMQQRRASYGISAGVQDPSVTPSNSTSSATPPSKPDTPTRVGTASGPSMRGSKLPNSTEQISQMAAAMPNLGHARCVACIRDGRPCFPVPHMERCAYCISRGTLCTVLDAEGSWNTRSIEQPADGSQKTSKAEGQQQAITMTEPLEKRGVTLRPLAALSPFSAPHALGSSVNISGVGRGLDNLSPLGLKRPAPAEDGTRKKARMETNNSLESPAIPSHSNGPVVMESSNLQKLKGGSKIAVKDLQRLNIAFALVDMLCSGAESVSNHDWEIIAHALAFKYTASTIRKTWKAQTGTDGAEFQKLRTALHEKFLATYERGEIPVVDFDNLQKTDWPALVRWVEKHVLPLPEHCEIESLPASRSELDDKYGTAMQLQHDREQSSHGETDYAPNFEIARSWVRAIALTRDSEYDMQQARVKMSGLDHMILLKAIQDLEAKQTLIRRKAGRQVPGRNYVLSKEALSSFQRWPGSADDFQFVRDVAKSRIKWLEHFRAHEEVPMDAAASEADRLVLTEMLSQGHLRLRSVLSDAALQQVVGTGKMDDNFSALTAVYAKTPEFSMQHHLKAGVRIPNEPSGRLRSAIPMWVDIRGYLIDEAWDMVLRSILHILVFKPGSTAKAIEEAHSGHLWVWEIELALAWMREVGIAYPCAGEDANSGAKKAGWRASEWWYCSFTPEIANWRAPSSLVERGGEVE